MSKSVQDNVRDVLLHAVKEKAKSAPARKSRRANPLKRESSGSPLSGASGIAAGASLAALAPLAARGVGKLIRGQLLDGAAKSPRKAVSGLASKLGDSVGSSIGEKVSNKVDEAGGPSGIFTDTLKSALPFGGGDDDDGAGTKGGVPGAGKGRRMPIQQSIDVGVPIETVYNQWTQLEAWPKFMHRVTRVTQKNPCTVSFATKIWGKTKEFSAEIVTQRPDERVKWRVTNGITHTGVVTFHELAPRLTRIELGLDVEPGGMLEKAARGMRHIKRAARGDLHRFKAFIEMQERETGAWRGVIEDGKVVKDHDPSYDKRREYAESSSRRSSRSRPSNGAGSGNGSGSRSTRRSSGNHSSGQRSRSSRAR
jgi:uncharacterized membrane protein